MARFTPNKLQRALFVEVMNAAIKSNIDLIDERIFNQIAEAWLKSMQHILTPLATIGREGAKAGDSGNQSDVLITMMHCMDPLPPKRSVGCTIGNACAPLRAPKQCAAKTTSTG